MAGLRDWHSKTQKDLSFWPCSLKGKSDLFFLCTSRNPVCRDRVGLVPGISKWCVNMQVNKRPPPTRSTMASCGVHPFLSLLPTFLLASPAVTGLLQHSGGCHTYSSVVANGVLSCRLAISRFGVYFLPSCCDSQRETFPTQAPSPFGLIGSAILLSLTIQLHGRELLVDFSWDIDIGFRIVPFHCSFN